MCFEDTAPLAPRHTPARGGSAADGFGRWRNDVDEDVAQVSENEGDDAIFSRLIDLDSLSADGSSPC